MNLVGNNIAGCPALNPAEGNYRRGNRINLPSNDLLKRVHNFGGCDNGIYRHVWAGGVSAGPANNQIEIEHRGHRYTIAKRDLSDRKMRIDVASLYEPHWKVTRGEPAKGGADAD